MSKKSEVQRVLDALDAEIDILQRTKAALLKAQGTPTPKKRPAKARPAETRAGE